MGDVFTSQDFHSIVLSRVGKLPGVEGDRYVFHAIFTE